MPIKAAAKKYMRVSARKRAQNDRWRNRLAVLQRKFKHVLAEKKGEDARTLYQSLQKTLDAAARRHVIHRNAAARKKSRLAAALKRNSL